MVGFWYGGGWLEGVRGAEAKGEVVVEMTEEELKGL